MIRSVFDTHTCSCDIIIADPCAESVPPCLPPYYWYDGDDKIYCACVDDKLCSQCEHGSIIDELSNGLCACQRSESEEMNAIPKPKPNLDNEKCRLYRNGSYFCPTFESMAIVSYFNESICECQTVSADSCSLREPPCKEPFYWYQGDDRVLCLCVHQVDCEDCLEDRIVEVIF